jgi:hypothetical protein
VKTLACCILAFAPVAVALAVAAPAPSTAPAAAASSAPATLTFTDDQQTFFVTVPGTWRAGKLPQGRGGMLLVGPAAKGKPSAVPLFRVQAGRKQADAPDLTLDQFAAAVAREITGKPAGAVKVEPAKVGGADARRFEVEKTDAKGAAITMHYVVVLMQPRSFLFTYFQEKDLFDPAEAKAIFDSVRWTEPPPDPRQ